MTWRTRLVAVIVSVAALATAGAAFGDANIHFSAKVRVLANSDEFQYHGKVRSNLEACQIGRTVRVTVRGHLIGQTGTGNDGRYSFRAAPVDDGSIVKFKLKPNGPDCPSATLLVEI